MHLIHTVPSLPKQNAFPIQELNTTMNNAERDGSELNSETFDVSHPRQNLQS